MNHRLSANSTTKSKGQRFNLLLPSLIIWFVLAGSSCKSQTNRHEKEEVKKSIAGSGMQTGAAQSEAYLGILKNKRVAVVANPTSIVENTHLVDTLIAAGIHVVKVFAPEHGFRGEAEAGEDVSGGIDKKTGVQVVSLYGNHKKPLKEDLAGIDLVVFDIQDVGVRFYTYISTLQYVMESCAVENIPILVLDRPNPNAHFIDGPVLKKEFASFVGMQEIPVVYGMTIGEYALMLNGEFWLADSLHCKLQVIKLKNWTHADDYSLPVPPSPNLPNQASVRLYPSLCFFEGTEVSLGRGTEFPFQCYGFPDNKSGSFEFTPVSIPGKAKTPPLMGKVCKGELLKDFAERNRPESIRLTWLISAYEHYPDQSKFFNSFFNTLSGNSTLKEQIVSHLSEERIRASWQPDIERFKLIRKKYLLYP